MKAQRHSRAGIINDDIAIQSFISIVRGSGPVVVVGCTAVVRCAACEVRPDPNHEYRSMFLANEFFAFPGRQGRITFFQVFAVEKCDFIRQARLDVWIKVTDVTLRPPDHIVDFGHELLQEVNIALFSAHHPFPVPLVQIDRVQVVQHLLRSDGVHIGV